MSFYGNITNTSRTTFQFDKVYPSRKTMDAACREDGIYNGRYVLVEYDTELSNSEYQKPWYIVKKPVVDIDQEDTGHNKIYAASPNSAQNNDPNFFNLTTLDLQLTKADLMQGTSFIYLQQGHVFSNYNEEDKLILFDIEGNIVENSEDNLTMFNNFWNPLPSSPTKDQMTLTLAKTYFGNPMMSEVTLNSMGVYLVYVVNGVARTTSNIDWSNLVNPNFPYAAGIVKAGCQYDYNLQSEMWQLMPNNEYTQENADHETITYIDIQLSESDEDTYSKNFNEDKLYYGNSRGYDSTVWQKVFVNGVEQYVMIAELNTVVPTFGITTDAPTLLPLNPHWGADSTNVYYQLHWQPQWGFRVKAADSKLTTQVIDPATGTLLDEVNANNSGFGKVYLRLSDQVNYPSDENVIWENHFENDLLDRENKKLPSYYDSISQSWVTNKNAKVPAAIYYNKDGFLPDEIHYSTDITDPDVGVEGLYNQYIAESGWDAEKDFIGFSPTGLSGNLYEKHDGYYGKYPQIDTQEFSIMLPSIGNIIAKVWDMVYGSRDLLNTKNTNPIKINKRNMNIEWENGTKYLKREGLRLRNDNTGELYNTNAMKTLAGCINTAHDLFGMIIVPVNANTCEEYEEIVDPITRTIVHHPNLSKFRDDRIYFLEDLGTYCYKTEDYDFEPLEESDYAFVEIEDLDQLTNDIIHNGQYFVKIQESFVQNGIEQVRHTKYENVADLSSVFELNSNLGIYAGDEFLYAIETINQNNPWSYQTREFFHDYTYEDGLPLHVKYYYRTVQELYTEIESTVKNYPYEIDNKVFNYFRESADGEIYSDDNEHNRYNYYYMEEYSPEAQDEFYYVNPGNPVDVSGIYVKNKYFYLKTNDNGSMSLIRDDSDKAVANRQYYEIDEERFILESNNLQADGFPTMYLPGRYYYKTSQGSYLLDWTIDGSDIKQYGEKEQYGNTWKYICYKKKRSYQNISDSGEIEIYIETISYEEIEDNDFASRYLPNTYFILNENNSYELCKDLTYDSNKTYYMKVISYTKRSNDSAYNIDDVLDREPGHELYLGDMSFYQDNTYFVIRRDNSNDPNMITEYRSLTVFDLTQQTEDIDNSFNPSKTYFLLKIDQAETGVKYYNFRDFYERTHEIIEPISNFYIPNLYHYKVNNDYIFAKDPDKVNGRNYYLIETISLNDYLEKNELDSNIIYGESTELYYKENGEYIKIDAFNEVISYPGSTLYIKDEVYVYEDNTPNVEEKLPRGMEWNIDALCIPNTIILARRKPYDTLKALPYYAVDTSTINGLILKNTKIIENNEYTRDLNLVSGALNKVKDLIARFYRIKSQELTIVDNAGRIHSAPLETWQTIGYNQNHEPIKKRWLISAVDGNLASPKVILNHTYNAETDSISTPINMNDYDDPSTENIIEHNYIDRINIANPRIDETGHVVAFNNQEVIFPYAFGRLYLNDLQGTLFEASSTHDYLILNTDDLLTIGFSVDANNNKPIPDITLQHVNKGSSASLEKAGNIANGENNNFIVTPHLANNAVITIKHGNSFNVPYQEIDRAGHTTVLKQDTIKLSELDVNYIDVQDRPLAQIPLQIVNSASFSQPSLGNLAEKDVLNLNVDVAGSFPVGRVYSDANYYNLGNQTITLLTETNNIAKINNRLQQLNKTNSYTIANTLGELTTIQFQRTKWLTEILEIVDMEATIALQSNFTQLQNEVDSINVAIGNNTIYTPDDPETNENEQRRVTIQQLTSRVAQLEEVIRNLISIDENTNSLNILSNEEIDEILDWDRITSDPTITVTFIHSIDNKITEENDYLISDWVRRGQFATYEGNDEARYYVLNQDLQEYEEIGLPFAVTRAFVDKYGQMSINEDEGQITIIEALSTPSL